MRATLERHVALLGFMGAGKTTVGRLLARELEIGFTDTDDLIAASNGSIAGLFARTGEAGFRAAEFEALQTALERPVGVVALGGGAVTHAPTRQLLADRTLRVYLDISVDALVARLRRSRTPRPILGPRPSVNRIKELLLAREPFYREAEIVVSGPRRSPHAFAREIADRIGGYTGRQG